MLDYLISVVSRMGHWRYLVIFTAAAVLESADFLGLFIAETHRKNLLFRGTNSIWKM